jgi:hypothetical protein
VSHQGLALSQQLSHPVGAHDAWVSHHMTYHLTHHMTSLVIHHMTGMWHITWLITWPLDLEKKSPSTCSTKSRKTKKNVLWDKSSQHACIVCHCNSFQCLVYCNGATSSACHNSIMQAHSITFFAIATYSLQHHCCDCTCHACHAMSNHALHFFHIFTPSYVLIYIILYSHYNAKTWFLIIKCVSK